MYKLLLVKNKLERKPNIQKGLDWFKGKIPNLEITELVTDFEVTTKKMTNYTFKSVFNVVCGDDLYDKLRSVIPEHKYHCVVFMFGNDLDGIRVNYTPYLPLYRHTDLVQLFNTTDGGKALNHEIFHALIHKAERQGALYDDPMDWVIYQGQVKRYFNDTNLDAVPSNRSIALDLLKGWWDKILKLDELPTTPTVTINRIEDNGTQTIGNLIYENFRCKTLERPWKDNKANISCIPKGTYKVKYTFSPKFMKYTYLLQNTGTRTGIRIHSGNYFFDIQGCILLGDGYKDINFDGKVDILNSRVSVNTFEKLLGKRDFTLVIN